VTINQKIARSALDVLAGTLKIETRPWFCLRAVRQIVQAATGADFYGRYLVKETSMREGKHVGNSRNDPWAADIESSLRHLGLSVKPEDMRAGDIVCSWKSAKPYGHIGIALGPDLVLENSPTQRGFSKAYRHPDGKVGYINLCPVTEFPEITGVFRLKE
jgi:hypothetical protein